jgi:hypothetical protein
MNLLEARVALRDRKTADVLDLALRFLVVNRVPFAKVALMVMPTGVVTTFVAGRELGWGWGWIIAIFLGLLAQAPFTALASRLVFEHDVRVRDVLRTTLARIPYLAIVRVTQLGVLAFAAMLFFVPALLVGGYTFFLGEVLLLERASPSLAVTRLQRLVSGSAGDAVLGVLLLAGLHVLATILGDVAGRALFENLFTWKPPMSAWDAGGGSLLAVLGFWLFLPFAATARLFLYLNVRTRAEGWDVQTRFSTIALRAEAEAEAEAGTKPSDRKAA